MSGGQFDLFGSALDDLMAGLGAESRGRTRFGQVQRWRVPCPSLCRHPASLLVEVHDEGLIDINRVVFARPLLEDIHRPWLRAHVHPFKATPGKGGLVPLPSGGKWDMFGCPDLVIVVEALAVWLPQEIAWQGDPDAVGACERCEDDVTELQ